MASIPPATGPYVSLTFSKEQLQKINPKLLLDQKEITVANVTSHAENAKCQLIMMTFLSTFAVGGGIYLMINYGYQELMYFGAGAFLVTSGLGFEVFALVRCVKAAQQRKQEAQSYEEIIDKSYSVVEVESAIVEGAEETKQRLDKVVTLDQKQFDDFFLGWNGQFIESAAFEDKHHKMLELFAKMPEKLAALPKNFTIASSVRWAVLEKLEPKEENHAAISRLLWDASVNECEQKKDQLARLAEPIRVLYANNSEKTQQFTKELSGEILKLLPEDTRAEAIKAMQSDAFEELFKILNQELIGKDALDETQGDLLSDFVKASDKIAKLSSDVVICPTLRAELLKRLLPAHVSAISRVLQGMTSEEAQSQLKTLARHPSTLAAAIEKGTAEEPSIFAALAPQLFKQMTHQQRLAFLEGISDQKASCILAHIYKGSLELYRKNIEERKQIEGKEFHSVLAKWPISFVGLFYIEPGKPVIEIDGALNLLIFEQMSLDQQKAFFDEGLTRDERFIHANLLNAILFPYVRKNKPVDEFIGRALANYPKDVATYWANLRPGIPGDTQKILHSFLQSFLKHATQDQIRVFIEILKESVTELFLNRYLTYLAAEKLPIDQALPIHVQRTFAEYPVILSRVYMNFAKKEDFQDQVQLIHHIYDAMTEIGQSAFIKSFTNETFVYLSTQGKVLDAIKKTKVFPVTYLEQFSNQRLEYLLSVFTHRFEVFLTLVSKEATLVHIKDWDDVLEDALKDEKDYILFKNEKKYTTFFVAKLLTLDTENRVCQSIKDIELVIKFLVKNPNSQKEILPILKQETIEKFVKVIAKNIDSVRDEKDFKMPRLRALIIEMGKLTHWKTVLSKLQKDIARNQYTVLTQIAPIH